MPIRAVIFDLDGLMIDSEPLSKLAWERLLGEYGYVLTDEEFIPTVGSESFATAAYIKRIKSLNLDVEQLVSHAKVKRLEIIRQRAEPVNGLERLINVLIEKKLILGVASNSPEEYVEAALQAIQMRDYFSCVVTVDHVKRGKPYPEVYLQAARCLDVEPEYCLALEDSPAGMQAAIAAGMRTVVVPNHDLRDADFSGAHSRFESLVEITGSLDQLLSD